MALTGVESLVQDDLGTCHGGNDGEEKQFHRD